MSILNWLGLGKEIAKPIEAVSHLYTTDKQRLDAQTEDIKAMMPATLAQLENNKTSLLSDKFFSYGWQNLIGWTAGFCVALYWVPQLILTDYIWFEQCMYTHKIIPYPINSDQIYNLVWLLFGFGGYSLIKKKIS